MLILTSYKNRSGDRPPFRTVDTHSKIKKVSRHESDINKNCIGLVR